MNDIVSDMNLKKIEKSVKFYQTYLFKLVTSSITIVTLIISGFYYTNNYIVEKSLRDIRKNITDSIQNEAIEEVKETNGNTNTRIDLVQSKQNIQEITINETTDDIKFIKKIVIFLANKIDKTIIPLLEDKQSERVKVNSLKTDTLKPFVFGDKKQYENPLKYYLFIN